MIEAVRFKIQEELWEFPRHALDRMLLRNIKLHEVKEALLAGEIIEDNPNDKYGPSCLIFGPTGTGRPLHIQCSYPIRPLVKVITVYEPNPLQWTNFRSRRKNS